MDELIKLSKEIISMDDEASELGLTEFEYAFYSLHRFAQVLWHQT
jgi:type I restriction enzyme R subunit